MSDYLKNIVEQEFGGGTINDVCRELADLAEREFVGEWYLNDMRWEGLDYSNKEMVEIEMKNCYNDKTEVGYFTKDTITQAIKYPIMQRYGKENRIRDLAYKKWEEAGKPDGRSDEFWFAAEKEMIPIIYQSI